MVVYMRINRTEVEVWRLAQPVRRRVSDFLKTTLYAGWRLSGGGGIRGGGGEKTRTPNRGRRGKKGMVRRRVSSSTRSRSRTRVAEASKGRPSSDVQTQTRNTRGSQSKTHLKE